MNKSKYKYFLIVVVLLLFVFVVFLSRSRRGVRVIFFDVGQGDACLIILPDGRKILIDGGPDDQVLTALGRDLGFFNRKIDLIILSHSHDDHIFGLIQILKRYQIGKVIHSSAACQTNVCWEFFAVIKDRGITMENLAVNKKITFSKNCFLWLWPPRNPLAKSINNRSVAVKLDCGDARILLTGDSETAREGELMEIGDDLKAFVFKANHHGSKTSNEENFLKMIQPSLIIVSVGVINPFGHPATSTINRFVSLGIRFLRTDKNGNISLYFDEKTYPQITIDKQTMP